MTKPASKKSVSFSSTNKVKTFAKKQSPAQFINEFENATHIDPDEIKKQQQKLDYSDNENAKESFEEEDSSTSSDDSDEYDLSDSEDSDDYSDSESDEEEDEDGELVTPEVDAQILRTLAQIKSRDGSIYDPKKDFFSSEQLESAKQEWNNKVPVSSNKMDSKKKDLKITEYQRNVIMDGYLTEMEAAVEDEPESLESSKVKKDLKKAFFNDQDDQDIDTVLQPSKAQQVMTVEASPEDSEYKAYLLENLAKEENAHQSMMEWLAYKDKLSGESSSERPQDDKFLIEYVLSRGWIEKDRKETKLQLGDEKEDERAVDNAEEFESKYNFRFEQPGGDKIITYPRQGEVIDSVSVRRTISSRAEKRAAAKERRTLNEAKTLEKEKEATNKAKIAIAQQLAEIFDASGAPKEKLEKVLQDEDSDEFDPEAHDRKMAELFNDDYYNDEDSEYVLPKELLADVKKKDKSKKVSMRVKEAEKIIDATAKLSQKDNKTASLLEEYNKLSYESKIDGGRLPCRFKYIQVRPCSFGLEDEEIINSRDDELNAHISLKRIAPYISEDQQEWNERKYGNKRRVYKFRAGLTAQQAIDYEEEKRVAREKKRLATNTDFINPRRAADMKRNEPESEDEGAAPSSDEKRKRRRRGGKTIS